MDLLNITKEYKKVISRGYYSIILISLSDLLYYLSTNEYGTLNGNFMALLSTGLTIIAIILFFYFLIKAPSFIEYYQKQVTDTNIIKHQIIIFVLSFLILYISRSLIP